MDETERRVRWEAAVVQAFEAIDKDAAVAYSAQFQKALATMKSWGGSAPRLSIDHPTPETTDIVGQDAGPRPWDFTICLHRNDDAEPRIFMSVKTVNGIGELTGTTEMLRQIAEEILKLVEARP